VNLPGWVILYSNTPSTVSANKNDPVTLRSRTYYPPPK
jgi:hypothetical protein